MSLLDALDDRAKMLEWYDELLSRPETPERNAKLKGLDRAFRAIEDEIERERHGKRQS